MSGVSHHSKQLCKHCCIFGSRFARQCRNKGKCSAKIYEISYNVDLNNDHEQVCPHKCHPCGCRMRRTEKAQGSVFLNPASYLTKQWATEALSEVALVKGVHPSCLVAAQVQETMLFALYVSTFWNLQFSSTVST